MINIRLDVTKIPKELIFKGKNGSYIDIVVSEMQNTDNYGNTHTVYLNQDKQEREKKADKIYIGKGKEVKFNNNSPMYTPSSLESSTSYPIDLPF